MKITSTLSGNVLKWSGYFLKWRPCLLLFLAVAGVCGTAAAQYAVTGVSISTTNSTTSTTFSNIAAASGTLSSGLTNTYSFTYGKATQTTGNNVQVNGFTANNLTFTYSGLQPTVSFRRVNINNSPTNVVTGKRVNLWFQRVAANNNLSTSTSGTGNGGTAELIPDYVDVLETLFATRTLNVGIDNVFQNAITTDNNNIERVDVVFASALQAIDNTQVGFAVFDRGPDGSNDDFQIAAIKTLDGSGNPASYFPPLYVHSVSYGTGLNAVNYHILRKEATETTLKMMNPNQGPQNQNGAFVTFKQLQVPDATITYGYSVFGTDVVFTAATAADMVDYTNSTYFPNNTDYGSTGGIDMVAITGVAYTSSSMIVLPVTVDYFNAVNAGGKVQLSWAVDITDHLRQAVIERSGDGTVFSPLLTFADPAAGNQTAYDGQPLPGINYYRLKLVNDDGSIAGYSSVSSVNMGQAAAVSLNIYPNPVISKRFTLDAQGLKNEVYDVRIFDMSGTLITEQPLTGNPVFSKELVLPGSISPGAYTLQLTDKNGTRVFVKTFMVQ